MPLKDKKIANFRRDFHGFIFRSFQLIPDLAFSSRALPLHDGKVVESDPGGKF
jgi:ABC-type lipoprotein export system ATPase subunit